MNYRIISDSENRTVRYAAAELRRVLTAMDETLTEGEDGLALTLRVLPHEEGKDAVAITVRNGVGTIAGEDPRGLLIAVYRFLYHLGCRWTVPGPFGEHIPKKRLERSNVNVTAHETPDNLFRGVCIEGAVSKENLCEMIEFLPRVGLNTYFVQFQHPTVFFQRWYEHWCSTYLKEEKKLTDADTDEMMKEIDEAIALRGLQHQAVGHGWTCEPFGVKNVGWRSMTKEEMPGEDYMSIVAECGGKRSMVYDCPMESNLCYSQEKVRETIYRGIVDYCRDHPEVDVVHFWLADSANRFCECEECRRKNPSDWYVMMLNELDDRMTAAGVTAKVVFLLYEDLLWAPKTERLKDSDRFILMFAPITRTYSETLEHALRKGGKEPAPFKLNHLEMPSSVYTNIVFLRQWQKMFKGKSFAYDYHMMWDHMYDLGYISCARVLMEDAQGMRLLGLDGLIACQLSRIGFPTGLPLYAMAAGLWSHQNTFEKVASEYFAAEFGKDGPAVYRYLSTLSSLADTRYTRGELPFNDKKIVAQIRCLPAVVEAFRKEHPQMRAADRSDAWAALDYHADYVLLMTALLVTRAEGRDRTALIEAVKAYVSRIEPQMQRRLDVWNVNYNTMRHFSAN